MTIKKYFFTLLLLTFCSTSFSQGEASNWFFGNNVGLHFDSVTGNTSPINGAALSTNEGSASISDSNGNLLFYTNGTVIWNKDNTIMQNGTGLLGNSTSTQSAIIVPNPSDTNIYYVFTVDGFFGGENNPFSSSDGLNYSVIDMSLDGGLGGVISGQKNINLLNTTSEKITAVKSGDCSSFWVITHFLDKFYSYKVSSSGVEITPEITTINPLVAESGYRYNAIGYLKASPDGTKIAIAHHSNGTDSSQEHAQPGELLVYDFNDITGQVSNGISLLSGPSPYGVEFSPNSKRLYTSVENVTPGPNFVSSELFFFDLEASNIPASAVSMIGADNVNTIAGALQLAPDGNIYRSMRGTPYLSAITNPDTTTPGYLLNYIQLNGEATFGLPPFIQSLFAEKVDIINNDNDPTTVTNTLSLCDGDTYTLAAEDIPGASYIWTLNGLPISNTTFDLADISVAGTYLVEVNPNNGDCPFFGEAIVNILPLPIINTITALEECYDPSDGLSDFTLSNANIEALTGQDTSVIAESYHANEANALAGTNTINTTYSSAGETIYIRLLNSDTGCVNAVPVNLVVNPLPVVNSPIILEQCDTDTDGSVSFNLNEANSLLSNNSTNETFVYFNTLSDAQADNNSIINATNYISVTGNSVFAQITNTNGCVNYGRVNLVVGTSAIPSNIQDTYTLCDDDYDGVATFDFSATHTTLNAIFSGINSTITYYENEADALAEINAIADISNHQNTNSPNSQTIWVRVDSNDLNGCLGLGEHITLTVNPKPEIIALTNVIGCSDTTTADFDLSNVYTEAANNDASVVVTIHETLTEAENSANPISSPYNSIATTLFVRSENTIGCYTIMPLDLVIEPLPIANTPDSIDKCNDAMASGILEFDLTIRHDQIIGTQTNVTVSYFTDQADAIAGFGPSLITNPNQFYNTTNPQSIYIHVVNNTTGCSNNTILTLNVLDAPRVFPFTNPLMTCDDDNDGVGYFDLGSIEADITGNTPGVTVTFHETLIQAEQIAFPIDTNELYQNIDTGNLGTQTIYASLTINGSDCITITEINLIVLESPELPSGEIVYNLCEDNGSNDGYVEFDLMDYALNTLGLDPALIIEFYTGLDASGNPIGFIPNFNNYTNVTTPDQVIYLVVSNANTDSNGDACTIIRSMTLHVDLLPNVPVLHDIFECDDDYFDEADGIYPFNLSAEVDVITGGVTGLVVEFYEVEADAQAGSGPSLITNPSEFLNTAGPGGDDVFARVYDASTGCYAITHIKLHVDANPTPLSNQEIIDQLGNGGVMEECDGNVDGSGSIAEQVAEFDLTSWETLILTGTGSGIETGVSASYYTSYDDADGTTNAIGTPDAYTNTSNPQTIYVRVTSDGTGIIPQTSGTGCYTIVQFDIFVPVPDVSVSGDTVLCVDENGVPLSGAALPVLTASPSTGGYEYQWALNGVDIPGAINETHTVTEAGVYTVTVSGPMDYDCVNSASITVEESGMPSGYDANVTTTAFADNHQIQATATSNIPGVVFYYTLDLDATTGIGVETNTTGLFTDVGPGLHYITITDGKACWSDVVEVLVIDYPHFFTPNGDGVNDTWQIIGVEGIPISIIYIFDRYGKLLKQLDPDGAGWDGTYNGHGMPAGDYWFTIDYTEGAITPTQKEFKAHFSLKR